MKLLIIISLTLTSLYLYSGCDDTISGSDIDNRIIPDSNVSYSKDIAPIFLVKCNSCHNSSNSEGGVDLSNYSGVINPAILVPYASDTSLLVWTVERRPGFAAMPPLESSIGPFTARQINGLKTWIDEGAKNN